MAKSKSKKSRLVKVFIPLILLLVLVVALFLIKENQDISSDAATGCGFIKNRKDCLTSCSPWKNSKYYKCAWSSLRQACYETSKECASENLEPPLCPSDTTNCTPDLITSGPSTKCKYGSSPNYVIWNCCATGTKLYNISGQKYCASKPAPGW